MKSVRILKSIAKRNFSKIQWRIFKLQKGVRKIHLTELLDKQREDGVFKKHICSKVPSTASSMERQYNKNKPKNSAALVKLLSSKIAPELPFTMK